MFFSGRYYYKNATFTASTPGQYMICASAMDTNNLTSPLACYTVVVGIGAPSILTSSLYPMGSAYVNPAVPFIFSCSFDKIVKRNSAVATIRLIDASTNLTVAAVNATNTTNVLLRNNIMSFNFGTAVQPFKTYYITVDQGIDIFL
jgi:hypothetical protein